MDGMSSRGPDYASGDLATRYELGRSESLVADLKWQTAAQRRRLDELERQARDRQRQVEQLTRESEGRKREIERLEQKFESDLKVMRLRIHADVMMGVLWAFVWCALVFVVGSAIAG